MGVNGINSETRHTTKAISLSFPSRPVHEEDEPLYSFSPHTLRWCSASQLSVPVFVSFLYFWLICSCCYRRRSWCWWFPLLQFIFSPLCVNAPGRRFIPFNNIMEKVQNKNRIGEGVLRVKTNVKLKYHPQLLILHEWKMLTGDVLRVSIVRYKMFCNIRTRVELHTWPRKEE